ncbi:hypothetical protein JCM16303_004544 [Sporobolomyces ruberrimus]
MFSRFANTFRTTSKRRLYTSMLAGTVPIVLVSNLSASSEGTQGGQSNGGKPSHHKPGGGFVNPWESFDQMDITPVVAYKMYKDWESNPIPPPERLPPLTIPSFTPPTSLSPTELSEWSKDIKCTFLGHACFLVEFPKKDEEERGLRVLFDPVWSHRCSPSQLIGPARVAPPPIKLEEIPHVDAVIISHNHYDHLDIATLKHLYKAQPPGSIHFFAPLGNKSWFTSNTGCTPEQVSELDWWESRKLELSSSNNSNSEPGKGKNGEGVLGKMGRGGGRGGSLKVMATPCQHFTGRGVFDRNDTLWASWSVESEGGGKVWFAGDTGYKSIPRGVPIEEEDKYPYCPAFKEIGEREGPFDLGMIPIGAYDPRWFMSRVHCSPEDSVELHRETKSRKSLGMHHSCWQLTCEPMDEPPKRLRKACEKYGISEEEFGVSGLGETRRFKVEKRGGE